MCARAINGRIRFEDSTMDYIAFGRGKKAMVIIPGLGDGLTTVKGLALPFSSMYREYARNRRVYVFSRKNRLPEKYTSRDMARDLKEAMNRLGISKADVLGVSQGGTIAQQLALEYPEVIDRLVLTVTYSRPNDTVRKVVGRWMDYARAGDFRRLMADTAEHSYSDAYLKKYRRMLPLVSLFGKPKSFDRFLTMADACLTHNCYDRLGEIKSPTLVIAGGDDKIVTCAASVMMAREIPGSRLYVYPAYGHAAYEEAKDFQQRVMNFLNE